MAGSATFVTDAAFADGGASPRFVVLSTIRVAASEPLLARTPYARTNSSSDTSALPSARLGTNGIGEVMPSCFAVAAIFAGPTSSPMRTNGTFSDCSIAVRTVTGPRKSPS